VPWGSARTHQCKLNLSLKKSLQPFLASFHRCPPSCALRPVPFLFSSVQDSAKELPLLVLVVQILSLMPLRAIPVSAGTRVAPGVPGSGVAPLAVGRVGMAAAPSAPWRPHAERGAAVPVLGAVELALRSPTLILEGPVVIVLWHEPGSSIMEVIPVALVVDILMLWTMVAAVVLNAVLVLRAVVAPFSTLLMARTPAATAGVAGVVH